jgi:hypothetical protein
MRDRIGRATRPFWLLAALLTAACVTPPPAGTPMPPRVEILTADARATTYGSGAAEMLDHPALREKVRALFGRDWATPAPPRAAAARRITVAPPEFFLRAGPPRVLRIAGSDYVGAPGCQPASCSLLRGLLLVRTDGEALLARLDEGGFSHYYGYAAGMAMTPDGRLLLDSAWRTLEPLP